MICFDKSSFGTDIRKLDGFKLNLLKKSLIFILDNLEFHMCPSVCGNKFTCCIINVRYSSRKVGTYRKLEEIKKPPSASNNHYKQFDVFASIFSAYLKNIIVSVYLYKIYICNLKSPVFLFER